MNVVLNDIDRLYGQLLSTGEDGGHFRIDSKVRSEIYTLIIKSVERLRDEQESHPSWSRDYWEIDGKIRRLLLKEVQIIIDDYVVAKTAGRFEQWEMMYGDIERYKDIFYRLRVDTEYNNRERPAMGMKFVRGKWERVEFMKIG
jgi:hypothetical protein